MKNCAPNKIDTLAMMFREISPKCHHMSLMDFVVTLPGCGRSVTDF
jgi:hypothetical protein